MCAIWGLLCVHTNFKVYYSSPVKNAIGNLLGSTVILIVLIESKNMVYLVVSPSFSFFVIPWIVARQAPLSMEFSRQE